MAVHSKDMNQAPRPVAVKGSFKLTPPVRGALERLARRQLDSAMSCVDAPAYRGQPDYHKTLAVKYMRAARITLLILSLLTCGPRANSKRNKGIKDSERLRTEYITKLQQQFVSVSDDHSLGSLWSDQATLGDLASDYKARKVNDTITIQVALQTVAAQSGSVDSERNFSTSSAITGVLGKVPVHTNPILSGQSSQALKGKGSAASNTVLTTSLTGHVIAVLPNGNLVVEAERQVLMNNQRENVIVRGIVREGDIGPSNIVPSTALSSLEIEMKGKGIVSDGVRPPNALTRVILKLLNF